MRTTPLGGSALIADFPRPDGHLSTRALLGSDRVDVLAASQGTLQFMHAHLALRFPGLDDGRRAHRPLLLQEQVQPGHRFARGATTLRPSPTAQDVLRTGLLDAMARLRRRMKGDAGKAAMVESETMDDAAIAAMMASDAVPMMHTIAIEIQRMEQGLCVAKVPRRLEWDGIYETFHGGMLGVIATRSPVGPSSRRSARKKRSRRPTSTSDSCAHATPTWCAPLGPFEQDERCVADAEIHDMNGKLWRSLRCPTHGSREATQDFLST